MFAVLLTCHFTCGREDFKTNHDILYIEWVSACMDLYSTYSLKTPNALHALVLRKQVRFE